MDIDEFASFLASDERRKWQDPLKISRAIGVKAGMTVADLACGPGFFTLPLASLVGEKGLVYAVDASSTMLNHLQAAVEKFGLSRETIKAIHADVSSSEIPSGSVDVAIFANVLHDLDDKRAFLREVRRICKPGGTIVDVDWRKIRMEFGPPFEIRLTDAESKRILSENGIGVARSIDAGPYHYGLVCSPAPS